MMIGLKTTGTQMWMIFMNKKNITKTLGNSFNLCFRVQEDKSCLLTYRTVHTVYSIQIMKMRWQSALFEDVSLHLKEN